MRKKTRKPRRTYFSLLGETKRALESKNPLGIYEVSKKIDSTYRVAEKCVKVLVGLGLVEMIKYGKRNKYRLARS